MLKTILSIAGKPGLYKLVSQGKNMLIVETISTDKKRIPAYATDSIVSLGDIAIYTNDAEVPLAEVFEKIKEKYSGEVVDFNAKKASLNKLQEFLGEILPDFDQDRVYASDIKKMVSWYNLLIQNGITEFTETEDDDATEEEA